MNKLKLSKLLSAVDIYHKSAGVKLAQVDQSKVKGLLDSTIDKARQAVYSAVQLERNSQLLPIMVREKFLRAEQNFIDSLNQSPLTIASIGAAIVQVNYMRQSRKLFGIIPGELKEGDKLGDQAVVWDHIVNLLNQAQVALSYARQEMINSYQADPKTEKVEDVKNLDWMDTSVEKVQSSPTLPGYSAQTNKKYLFNQSTGKWQEVGANWAWSNAPVGSIIKTIEDNQESFYKKTRPDAWSLINGDQFPKTFDVKNKAGL